MVSAVMLQAGWQLLGRAVDDDADPGGDDISDSEAMSSWAIFISICLLIVAFFTSYLLQQKKVEAVHETVISIFAGMVVGLLLLVTPGDSVRNMIKFSPGIFFNLLLPPIILSSGYELHQANFFRNIGIILTFAFAGTFLSAVVIGLLLYLFSLLPGSMALSFVDAISVGATLSATDPVTILAIFNSYKVDPKLYTIIFGESILNDAIAIVIFETAQRYKKGEETDMGFLSFLEGIGIFGLVFFGSLLIGVLVGAGTALLLKFTYIRRYPKIESCLVVLISYATYFFSNGVHMSGKVKVIALTLSIVSLLFCGITLKHYAYFNMSRRTQLSTKYMFQVLAQLSENFIFIYLGLSLFTDNTLVFQPPLIIVTVLAVCIARWVAVFPLSRLINAVIRYRSRNSIPTDAGEELSYSYQAMLFWAGLRGAVGVALAALLQGDNSPALRATVLVVVVLTVIIFGGTTARMLEILGIRTGVVEEADSDDEFDIESFGNFAKRNGTVALDQLRGSSGGSSGAGRSRFASGHSSPNPSQRPPYGRKNSAQRGDDADAADLLAHSGSNTDSDFGSDIDTSDLPPAAARRQRSSPHNDGAFRRPSPSVEQSPSPAAAGRAAGGARSAIRQLLTAEDPAVLFRQLDEDFIKPTLLLDSGGRGAGGHGNGNGNGGPSGA
ncbi:probable NA+-H+ antiporter [Cephalotrichum gorgonifer]|uniref:Sodium/hydrogen exchanger n=1 Tax=Cephalotrichum gorgonifer TaxID=2041049 RepID=A0AAE8N197_9PEZI|nr:probable NA+-H+ antiporter [Cephalotrichum gorgonifer]